ncbi:winged helix-turn-helix domain-containing protein, partial [Allocoleopsis sp.]|uniref:winged helix-turn-helix domain-containing protein n=1 Tax=Allocoleopsis sp. TaxID=3088169 RepID=UPI002FD49F4D
MNLPTGMSKESQSLNAQALSYGKILVDTDCCKVTYDGQIVTLLPKEYNLLVLFLKYPNHVLSYEVIIDRLWNLIKC